jgi:hypothetical protein
MKKDKNTEPEKDSTKVKKDKATSGGGKDQNDGGLPASQLKNPNNADKSGRSGGKGA